MTMVRSSLWCAAILGTVLATAPVAAQQVGEEAGLRQSQSTTRAKTRAAGRREATQPAQKRAPKDPGTPLDTILNTRLYADVPEVKDFVRASRPAPEGLDYQPITPQLPGSDPVRPKPRDAKQLGALEREMDRAISRNKQAGAALNRHVKTVD